MGMVARETLAGTPSTPPKEKSSNRLILEEKSLQKKIDLRGEVELRPDKQASEEQIMHRLSLWPWYLPDVVPSQLTS
ncbi:UNVERIFIED_CONTAM: hypothetical protein Sradi_5616600 [Sesamum radiatum]|uniref:Uncharacterized protein n=1 Tax=Sesamum radiatum TaxID=300843 RepID=A0AAW2L2H6_SESRA